MTKLLIAQMLIVIVGFLSLLIIYQSNYKYKRVSYSTVTLIAIASLIFTNQSNINEIYSFLGKPIVAITLAVTLMITAFVIIFKHFEKIEMRHRIMIAIIIILVAPISVNSMVMNGEERTVFVMNEDYIELITEKGVNRYERVDK